MPPEPNVDRLAAEYDQESRWSFTVPAVATALDGQVEELLTFVATALDCCRPLIRFHSCEIVAVEYEKGVGLEERYDQERIARHTARVTADERNGLTVTEIRDGIERLLREVNATVVTNLLFDDAETHVVLSDFEGYVDSQSADRYRRFHDGDWESAQPADDPITAVVQHTRPATSNGVDTDFAHRFELRTETGIWFGTDEIAATNRRRLADVLGCLHAGLPDGNRHFGGEYWGEYSLAEAPNLGRLVPWMNDR
jgi:hypothetical protein